MTARIHDPLRRWKLSTMDLQSYPKWYAYSKARDRMFQATDTPDAPWYVLRSDDKQKARLNCMAHILSIVPYKRVAYPKIVLPKRSRKKRYDDQATLDGRRFVPESY